MNQTHKSIRRMFLDIEVSPNVGLFWKPGYKVQINHDAVIIERAIMCVCWKFEGESKVYSLQWDSKQSDRELLRRLLIAMEEADEVIGHFAQFFDVPWLRTRVLFHGLNPMPLFKVIDTKVWASRHFLFNSNKLDYISKFLGSTGKIKTEWSWWADILLRNCRTTLAKMVHYCKKDVLELEFVWKKLQPHVPSETHAGVISGYDKWTDPHDGSKNVRFSKQRITATGQIRYQMQNQDTGAYFSITKQAYESYKESRLPAIRQPAAPRNRRR